MTLQTMMPCFLVAEGSTEVDELDLSPSRYHTSTMQLSIDKQKHNSSENTTTISFTSLTQHSCQLNLLSAFLMDSLRAGYQQPIDG
ncbi:alpha-mannosidase [Trichonephila clavipes]|nr:alpha-mannosidase [Trichonephila clavipes]